MSRNMNVLRHVADVSVPPVPVPCEMDHADVEVKIHCMEKEAYGALLRAFSAQSDSISLDKLPLISEVRKELKISDLEQRELLAEIEMDDEIREIRQTRKDNMVQQKCLSNTMKTSSLPLPTSRSNSAHKKLRTPAVPSVPSLECHRRGEQPSLKLAIRTRGVEPCGDSRVVSAQENASEASKLVVHHRALPVVDGGGQAPMQSSKGLANSGIYRFEKKPVLIRVPNTNKIVFEVERIYQAQNPEPAVVEKAKVLLEDCQRALLEALQKLADVMHRDEVSDQQYYDEQVERNRPGSHQLLYGQFH